MSTPVTIEAVPGLYACTEFFSHQVERDLYHDRYLFPKTVEQVCAEAALCKQSTNKNLTRTGEPRHAFQASHNMPDLLVKVCNGITESGLFSDFIAPNYCLPWSYPDKGQFYFHYDSRFRWGETVVGITLGTSGVMSFAPQTKKARGDGPPFVGKRSLNEHGLAVNIRCVGAGKKKNNDDDDDDKTPKNWIVDVMLPPRTCYVMSGMSRTEWKHMVCHNNDKNRFACPRANPAFFNCQVRRTITLRCTKVFSDEVLHRCLSAFPDHPRFQARIKAQNKFRPEGGYQEGKIDDHELQRLRQEAAHEVTTVHQHFRRRFFTDDECGYWRRSPGQSCWPLEGVAGGAEPSTLVAGSSGQGVSSLAAAATTGFRLGDGADDVLNAIAGGGGMVGGVDDNGLSMDPQLAMALRLSMQDERARAQERSRASGPTALSLNSAVASASSSGSTTTTTHNNNGTAAAAALSKEELRAKRLAALDRLGGGSSSSGSSGSPPSSHGKRKSASNNTVDLLDSDSSSSDDDNGRDNPNAKRKKPEAKPMGDTVNLLDDSSSDEDDDKMNQKPRAKKEKPTVIHLDG